MCTIKENDKENHLAGFLVYKLYKMVGVDWITLFGSGGGRRRRSAKEMGRHIVIRKPFQHTERKKALVHIERPIVLLQWTGQWLLHMR